MKECVKETRVVEELRRRIASRELRPGSRLPTYERLELDCGASRMTLQRAVARLKRDGFVTSVERTGLFVSDFPPCFSRYGILIPSHERFSRFWRCFIEAANAMAELSPARSFSVFRNLDDTHHSSEEWRRMREEVRDCRLAGIISLFGLEGFCSDMDFFRSLSIPLVTAGFYDGFSAGISFDYPMFVEKAMAHFKAKGRRKVAVISKGQTQSPILDGMDAFLATHGWFHSPFHWRMPIDNPAVANHITQLLLSLPAKERPDALLIADDHLIEYAAKGIVACGVRVPQDLEVIAHCNWREVVPCPLAIRYLGYDTNSVLLAALNTIDSLNSGRQVDRMIDIKPLFEEELVRKPALGEPSLAS